jgi:hypothetical protein
MGHRLSAIFSGCDLECSVGGCLVIAEDQVGAQGRSEKTYQGRVQNRGDERS